jgi:hypothetical protein
MDRVAGRRDRRGLVLVVIYPDHDEGELKGCNIVDVSDGHVVLHVSQYRLRFTPDGRFVVATDVTLNGNGFVKYDLATGKRAWTTIPTFYGDGFYMIFPDGRVRYSKTPSLDFALVRGFEVRPFDGAAAKQFVAPPGADDAP